MAKVKPVSDWTREQRDEARAILLEPSPYESDGGELIGRGPRKITAEDWARAGLEGQPHSPHLASEMSRLRRRVGIRDAEVRRNRLPELAVSSR
jgi:hypothetical protein